MDSSISDESGFYSDTSSSYQDTDHFSVDDDFDLEDSEESKGPSREKTLKKR